MNSHKRTRCSVHRELAAYGKEEVKQQERIDKLKQNDADDADIRKQVGRPLSKAWLRPRT